MIVELGKELRAVGVCVRAVKLGDLVALACNDEDPAQVGAQICMQARKHSSTSPLRNVMFASAHAGSSHAITRAIQG